MNTQFSGDQCAPRKPLLSRVLEVLNDRRSAVGDELRGLVDQWLQAPNLMAMLRTKNMTFQFECKNAWQAFWVASSKDRSADFGYRPGDTPLSEGSHVKAVRLFVVLTLDPKWNKLAGPCSRCHNYYLKKKASQKRYCSRRCGNAATAIARTRKKLAADRADKLCRAATAVRKLRRSVNWKQAVAAKHRDITPKFLTRAVNKAAHEPVGPGWSVKDIVGLLESSRREQLARAVRSLPETSHLSASHYPSVWRPSSNAVGCQRRVSR